MSFYSYKNANSDTCPGVVNGNILSGLNQRVCVQVKNIYDSCLQQQQLTNVDVTITSYAQVVNTGCCNSCCQYYKSDISYKLIKNTYIIFNSLNCNTHHNRTSIIKRSPEFIIVI